MATTRDSRGAVALRVVAVAVVLALAAGVTYLASREVLPLDRATVDQLNILVADRPGLVTFLDLASTFGSEKAGWILLTASAAIALLLRRVRAAIFVIVTTLGWAALRSVKDLVGRERPTVHVTVVSAGGEGFPSNHVLTATVVAGVLIVALYPVLPRRLRIAAICSGVVLAATVAFARLALGVHYVSDVVAGFVLGAALLTLTLALVRPPLHSRAPPTGRDGATNLPPSPHRHAPPARPSTGGLRPARRSNGADSGGAHVRDARVVRDRNGRGRARRVRTLPSRRGADGSSDRGPQAAS
jgi:undecaprenyl-diphosphatase